MGEVRTGPPKELMTKLSEGYNIDYFIETGTAHGTTANWASDVFKNVKTIELSNELYNDALDSYGNVQNIEFHEGRSQEKLPEIIRELDSSAMFWLDAHYSGGETAGQDYQCPLLEELEAMKESDNDKYIFIDDARMMHSPPPKMYSTEDFPTISELISIINKNLEDEYYTTIIEDVIIVVPHSAKNIVINYGQDVAGRNSGKQRIEEGVSKVKLGIKLSIQGLVDILSREIDEKYLEKIGIYSVCKKLHGRFYHWLSN